MDGERPWVRRSGTLMDALVSPDIKEVPGSLLREALPVIDVAAI